MISIIKNGSPDNIAPDTPIAAALESWGHEKNKVAVAINGQCITRAQYTTHILQAGDEIEILSPMQGG